MLRDPLLVQGAEQSLRGSLAIGLESTRMRVNWIGRTLLDNVTDTMPSILHATQLITPINLDDIERLRLRLRGPQVTILEGTNVK